jgi:tetratricopeptide (TPR) repeat protein
MSTEHKCPDCGAPLPEDAPKGLCPECLLGAALEAPSRTAEKTDADLQSPEEQPSRRIGRYKILQKLGEGGCGVVYMAEQSEPIRRRVALKIIKMGMDTRQVIARFEAERQALALMDHPNIAKVLDAGATETGRPYFVMELVKGTRITNYCDDNQLSTIERLRLFIQVCQAIQHAHQKGVIHRDIKPSNILVTLHDGAPVPKVIDFGIAKAIEQPLTEKTVFTALGQFMGTPAYMSPEQAELSGLDLDTRSDIYALGVLLYELLTGRTPFDTKELLKAGLDEMRRRIREEEPVRPSTRLSTMVEADLTEVAQRRQSEPTKLARFIRGDLDWIVMRCLEKDRNRRYETANGLAMDVRRHLNNEPVVAGPPTAVYRVRKFARRNKAALLVAVAMAVTLIAATALSTWQAIQARRAERLANQRLSESQAMTKFLRRVFESPDPNRDGRTITVAEILGAAATNLDSELADQPATRAELRATLGSTLQELGLPQEALPLQEKALEHFRAVLGPENHRTIQEMNELAVTYREAGRREACLKLFEEILAYELKTVGSNDLHTLKAMNNVAITYDDAGRFQQAFELKKHVYEVRNKVLGPDDLDTLKAMHNLASSYWELGLVPDALKMQEELMPRLRKALKPEHPMVLQGMNNLASCYFDLGRMDQARRLHEQLLPLCRKVLGPEAPFTMHAMQNLANSYAAAGFPDQALKLREQTLELRRKVIGSEHGDTLMSMGFLADSYSEQGRIQEALTLREEAYNIHKKVDGPEHPATIYAVSDLATSYAATNRQDEGLKLAAEAVALSQKVRGPEHLDTIRAMGHLATCYESATNYDAAIKQREKVLQLRRKVSGPEHFETLSAEGALANALVNAKRWDEAIAVMEASLLTQRRLLPPNHPVFLESLRVLGTAYERVSRDDDAKLLADELAKLKSDSQAGAPSK